MTDPIRLKQELLFYIQNRESGEHSLKDPVCSEDMMEFIDSKQERMTFLSVYENLKVKKKAGRDAEICRRANLRKDTLARMKSERSPVRRDYLWALAVAMKLDLKETEELFASCSQVLFGRYHMNEEELKRERAFEYFIINNYYDIDEINRILQETGIEILGNCST